MINFFTISAPSGSGKTTLCKAIQRARPEMKWSVSYTTRSKRIIEENGIDYQAKDEYDVEFPRGPLGLKLGSEQGGVVVISMKPGGFAERSEKIQIGDQIVAIKDEVVLSIALKDANKKIHDASRPLLIRFKQIN